jgi:hypothetical protein
MDKTTVDTFEKLVAQFDGLHSEIGSLGRKSPNDALNNFKLTLVNNLIISANKLLGVKYKPFSDFEKFDGENIPSNSDVTFILAQYISCFEKFRSDNIKMLYDASWYWVIDIDGSRIPTSPPRKIKG